MGAYFGSPTGKKKKLSIARKKEKKEKKEREEALSRRQKAGSFLYSTQSFSSSCSRRIVSFGYSFPNLRYAIVLLLMLTKKKHVLRVVGKICGGTPRH